MANGWGIWNQVLSGLGENFAGALSKKWERDALNSQLQNALYQKPGSLLDPTLGDMSPRATGEMVDGQLVPTSLRPDVFSRDNLPNILSLLQSPEGSRAVQGIMQMEQLNAPKYTPINQEGGGFGYFTQGRNAPPTYTEVKPPILQQRPQEYLLRTESITEGNRKKYLDVYGYINSAGKEVVTNRKPIDMTESGTGAGSASGLQIVPTNEGLMFVNKKTQTVSPVQSGGQTLGKPPSNEMVTTTTQMTGLKESLDRVKELYNQDYVGPVAGRLAGVREQTTGLPEEQAQFYSNLADIQNTLIYLKSGKQINESEYQRLKRQLPEKDLPPSVFNARMKEFERMLDGIIATRSSNTKGYGQATQAQPKSKFKVLKVE